ncbi:response regulator [Pseudobacteroides cellulosolvens]|uniref:Stage 0 sporulation protein A homolog n=1 Tax=Pseudobacteroides cellulosolvens ATCC 35603 = DSM 2933 TaxID=398512 RepID=A0A0L6JJM1_9FIRM|nr:response regulator [Pseudobacteroides cellulosolvens]KNY25954.1 response regulator receiver protein [Pseudobacteroides cellulosolvens ATCC 35603 = DSM 2933]
MKILVVEDDFASRQFLSKFLSQYGTVDITVDGLEALDAYLLAVNDNSPYDFICLDIMMPKVDGVKVLKAIRDYETSKGLTPDKRVKVVMTTALQETSLVKQSFEIGCEAYAAKPIDTEKFIEVMQKLGLINT